MRRFFPWVVLVAVGCGKSGPVVTVETRAEARTAEEKVVEEWLKSKSFDGKSHVATWGPHMRLPDEKRGNRSVPVMLVRVQLEKQGPPKPGGAAWTDMVVTVIDGSPFNWSPNARGEDYRKMYQPYVTKRP